MDLSNQNQNGSIGKTETEFLLHFSEFLPVPSFLLTIHRAFQRISQEIERTLVENGEIQENVTRIQSQSDQLNQLDSD